MRKSITVAGFTIIELIAVIAIISVLTGLLLAGVAKVRASAKIKKAKATMEQLEAALEMYSQNYGTYPPDEVVASSNKFTRCAELIRALEAEDTPAKKMGGPYVKYAATLKDGNGSLLDPWGGPYRYHWSTIWGVNSGVVTAIGQRDKTANITYNIWSSGPDKINDEMISNPNYPEPLSPDVQRRSSDDIVNW